MPNATNFAHAYDTIHRLIASRLRRRIEPARLDDAIQTATVHAWSEWTKLATTRPELDEGERAILAARSGCFRWARRVSAEPRQKHYRDAMDYVSPDTDVFHLPAHAGKVSYRDLSANDAAALEPAERDAMIAQLPAQLRPYATLAAQGVTQSKIAERRGESHKTAKRRLAAVKTAIRELAAARQAATDVEAWLADGLSESREIVRFRIDGSEIVGVVVDRWQGGNWKDGSKRDEWVLAEFLDVTDVTGREWTIAERETTPVTESTYAAREAIRECDEHSSLVVTTDRAPVRDRAIRAYVPR